MFLLGFDVFGGEESDVNAGDGYNDASEEQGGKFVDVFDPHEHQSGHGYEEEGAVHTHVVQHGLRHTLDTVADRPEQRDVLRDVRLQHNKNKPFIISVQNLRTLLEKCVYLEHRTLGDTVMLLQLQNVPNKTWSMVLTRSSGTSEARWGLKY